MSATSTTARSGEAPNGWPWHLLDGFRAGRSEALRDVYRLYADDVSKQLRFGFSFESRGRAHRFVGYGSAFDLQDALHETFRRAFEPRAREGYDGIRPYLPYLRTIARNVVLRSFRKREVLFPAVDDDDSGTPAVTAWGDEGPSPEQTVASEQVQALVRGFLDTLEPDARKLLELRFIDGQSQRDAAESLGLGRQQVRSREAKLRTALVRYLKAQGESGLVSTTAMLALLSLAQILCEGVRA
ncbi:MAG: sigma-70 family RNA polymerase sigma factor [Myxococcota bacterium]